MYSFNEIEGNKDIISFLQRSIKHQKVSHAYIIGGNQGMGKRLLANTFAKTLQCEVNGTSPCNACISCRTFDAGNNPDVIYISPEKTKYLSVQDIRQRLNSDIDIRPYRNKYKIYILSGTEKMSLGAQNALLKTLEEPPAYGVIILLSNNPASFLKTILSRCVTIRLNPLLVATIKNYLIKKDIPEYKAAIAALYSMGSIGRGLFIATNEDFSQMRQNVINITTSIQDKDLISLFAAYKDFEVFKDCINDCLDVMTLWFRDILIVKELGIDYALQKDKLEDLSYYADKYTLKGVFNILDSLEDTRYKLSQNASFQLAIEILLIKIKRNMSLT